MSRPTKTVIVLGSGRGGTSAVAGAIHLLGIRMMESEALNIANPSDVVIVVSVIENDNGVPEQYQEVVNLKVGLSLTASAGAPTAAARAARLAADINNVLNGIDLPIPVELDDDHIGTQQLVLDDSDLISVGQKDRVMRFAGDGAEFELVFRFRSHQLGSGVAANPQDKWVLTMGNRILVIVNDGRVFAHDIVGNQVVAPFQIS